MSGSEHRLPVGFKSQHKRVDCPGRDKMPVVRSINGRFSCRVTEGALDVLPAQPAHAPPHLRPERTLHGIVDCGALERLGGTIEMRQQECEDQSPHCSARAELRGQFLAEGANKEALAEPSRPQAPQYAQPRRAYKREQESAGSTNATQAQQPLGQQHGQKYERVNALKKSHAHQHQENGSDARAFRGNLVGAD
eukprot:scaffold31103_cov54-Phaeocystis_antarctica.AAC.4